MKVYLSFILNYNRLFIFLDILLDTLLVRKTLQLLTFKFTICYFSKVILENYNIIPFCFGHPLAASCGAETALTWKACDGNTGDNR